MGVRLDFGSREAREKCLTEPLTSFQGNSRIDNSINLLNSCWRITRKRYQQRPPLMQHPLPLPLPPPSPPPRRAKTLRLSIPFKSKATESRQSNSRSAAKPQLYRSFSRVMENHSTPNSNSSISLPSAIGWPRRKPSVPRTQNRIGILRRSMSLTASFFSHRRRSRWTGISTGRFRCREFPAGVAMPEACSPGRLWMGICRATLLRTVGGKFRRLPVRDMRRKKSGIRRIERAYWCRRLRRVTI